MLVYSRRFTVWLVSFLAVLVVYFIYNRVSRTPAIIESSSRQIAEQAADVCDSNDKVGKVGEVGVGVVKNARYTKLNAQKQVEREFEFEELLHQDGNEWEIKNPYMTIYQHGFKCVISGRSAKVLVEVSGSQVMPKEGTLTGDVTIRIWPRSKGGFGEGVLYLDDVSFVGEKSMFSTAGQVEYVSDDVRLAGTGMELVYNGDEERLEFLKIAKLQGLHIKRWSRGAVLGSTSLATGGSGASRQTTAAGAEGEKAGLVKPGQAYRCVLDKNVVIETVRERLLAEVVSINDIFMRGGEADPCLQPPTTAFEGGHAGAGEGGVETPPSEQKAEGATSAIGGQRDANWAAVETAGDVAISCDGSIVITPMGSAAGQMTEDRGQKTDDGGQRTAEALRFDLGQAMRGGKTMFCGGRVDYSVATGEAVAPGSSQIIFDVNDKSQGAPPMTTFEDRQGKPATVKITSQRQARFEPASNKVSFEGDSRCTVSQVDGNSTRQYFILADKLEVDLARKDGNKPGTSLDVERLIATGGEVHLASTKRVGERFLAGVELKCARMDYDTVDGNFIAAGPGLIKVDNSQTDEPQKGLGRFSLRRKCYAFLRNFDSLAFSRGSNHLIADSRSGSLLVDYFPLAEGRSEEDKVAVTASHVEADILETAQGRTEMRDFTAKGAVTYEDKDMQFAGGELVYDANNAVINVYGDKSRPCMFNGAIVDTVRYDVKTGKANTRIKGPGAIR
jgi:hypothetical protein